MLFLICNQKGTWDDYNKKEESFMFMQINLQQEFKTTTLRTVYFTGLILV